MERTITRTGLEYFPIWLRENARVHEDTISQYVSRLEKLKEFLAGQEITKEALEEFKYWLVDKQNYKTTSANAYLFAVRAFCRAMEWETEITVTAYNVEPAFFNDGGCYIARSDYQKLVSTALYLEDYRLMMIIQTLCHMDLRFSELELLTVEAVGKGFIDVKRRKYVHTMKIPEYLRESLSAYIRQSQVESGVVFCTATGNPVNRSNIWKDLKHLCRKAGVEETQVSIQKLKMPKVHDYYPFYSMVESEMCR